MKTNTAELDPVMLEVIWQRLISIVTEQMISTTRTAFSPILREAGDLGTAIFDAKGRMLAHGDTGTPGHIIPMIDTVRYFLEEFPAETLQEGDVLMTNDPWRVSGHLFDIAVATPIFHGGALVAIAISLAHHGDIGGRGYGPHANDVYEEGLFIPPAKILEQGHMNPLLRRIIQSNVRQPDILFGDLNSQITGNQVAVRRIQDLIDEYELDRLDVVADEIIARSEKAARKVISEVADGQYSAAIKVDGYDQPLDVVATVTVKGDELNVDFTGTSPQSPKGINVCLGYTAGYVVFALRCALGSDIPTNHGSLAPLTVTSPPATVVNAAFPAPVAARHMTGQVTPGVVLQALAKALPDRVIADGAGAVWLVRALASPLTGKPRTSVVLACGGMGARPTKDGLGTTCYPSGITTIPIEVMEADGAFFFHEKSYRPDSGGAGKYRGGLGQRLRFDVLVDGDPIVVSAACARTVHPANGLWGGKPGAVGRFTSSGATEVTSKAKVPIESKVTITMETPGGGGFGPPAERDSIALQRDIAAGFVTKEAAGRDYV